MMNWQDPEVSFALEVTRNATLLAGRVKAEMAQMNLTKGDLSPVTVGDFASQAYVAHALERVFANDLLVGEESAAALRAPEGAEMLGVITRFVAELAPGATEARVCDWIDRGNADGGARFWTLDPIDGTKGYLRGGQYAVALALIENGKVKLGALGCPHLGRDSRPGEDAQGAVFLARRGGGAWSLPLHADNTAPERMTVSALDTPSRARMMRSFEDSHTNAAQVDAIAAELGIAVEPVRMDSQAKFAVLAAGGAELLLRLLSPSRPDYKEKIWDQAAGAVLLEEAGGQVTDLAGRPLDFSQGRMLLANTGVFASNGRLHQTGLDAIAAAAGRPE